MNKTEIREFGDGKTIVVYTEDNNVYRYLREWRFCQRAVPYEFNSTVVAFDLYFPKGVGHEIREALKGRRS